MRSRRWQFAAVLAFAAVALVVTATAPVLAGPVEALRAARALSASTTDSIIARARVAPYQCGVRSSSFARICRPQAHASCLGAVARGVKGYTKALCAARKFACSSCLTALRVCIDHIGRGKRSEYSCEECTGKFSRCIGRRYPAKG